MAEGPGLRRLHEHEHAHDDDDNHDDHDKVVVEEEGDVNLETADVSPQSGPGPGSEPTVAPNTEIGDRNQDATSFVRLQDVSTTTHAPAEAEAEAEAQTTSNTKTTNAEAKVDGKAKKVKKVKGGRSKASYVPYLPPYLMAAEDEPDVVVLGTQETGPWSTFCGVARDLLGEDYTVLTGHREGGLGLVVLARRRTVHDLEKIECGSHLLSVNQVPLTLTLARLPSFANPHSRTPSLTLIREP